MSGQATDHAGNPGGEAARPARDPADLAPPPVRAALDRRSRAVGLLALATVIVAAAARFVHLDADPDYYAWFGYVPDEGRWTEAARQMALVGRYAMGDHLLDLHLALAPLFQLVSLVFFALLGVGRVSARLFPALAGAGLLLGLWAGLRRLASPSALLLALSLVAFQADFFFLSRVAVPEAPLMLVEWLVFLVLASGSTPARLLIAGLLCGVALAVKMTALFFVLIAAVIVVTVGGDGSPARRLRNLAYFAAPVSLAALSGAIAALAIPVDFGSVWSMLNGRFLGVSEPASALWFFLRRLETPVLLLPALGLWLGILGALAGPPAPAVAGSERRFRLALLWAGLFALVFSTQRYFPERYVVHWLLPLAAVTALGVSRLESAGLGRLAARLRDARGARAWALAALVALPAALLVAPALSLVAAAFGVPLESGRNRVGAIAVACALSPVLARRVYGRVLALQAFIALPAMGALVGLGAFALGGVDSPLWPGGEGSSGAMSWIARLAIASVLAAVAMGAARRFRPGSACWPVTGAAGFGILVWAASVAPGLLWPRFTIPEASRDLGRRLDGAKSVGERMAEGLFLDNTARFAPIEHRWQQDPPEFLLLAFRARLDVDFLKRNYEVVTSYDLYLSPQFTRAEADWPRLCCTPEGRSVTLYRLKRAPAPAVKASRGGS